MKRTLSIICIALLTALGTIALPGPADALSVQDILVMAKQGVSDEILITVIQSADDLPDMHKEDYAALKSGGVSPKVIAKLAEQRRKIENRQKLNDEDIPTQSNDAKNTPVQTPTAPVQAPTAPVQTPTAPVQAPTTPMQAPTAPVQTPTAPVQTPTAPVQAPTAPVQAPENAIQLPNVSMPSGAILAPLESSNAMRVFRAFFEEAYQTYNVEAQVAQRYDELREAGEQARATDAELPTVAAYRADIAAGHPVRALESCFAMAIQMKPHPDTPLGAALNQCIGDALTELGAFSMGAVYLDRALQSEADIPDYSETFQRFIDYAHQTDYASTAPLRIKAHDNAIAPAARDAYNYFIGYSLIYGPNPDTTLAYHILRMIKSPSLIAARAKILLSILDVRAPNFRFKTAADNLHAALEILSQLDAKNPDVFDLKNTAWLALARIASENHAYDAADAFYRNVDVESHHLKDALSESAWNALLSGNYSNALALTHALHAPLFNKAWLPDSLMIEAGAYLGLCRYDSASRAVEKLRKTYIADANALRTYMAQTPARDYYVQILRHAENPRTSPLPPRLYARVIADLRFRNLHRSLQSLTHERKTLGEHVGAEFSAWNEFRKIYDDAIDMRRQVMATLIGKIFEQTLTQLHALDISASQAAIEIRLSERKRDAECLKIVAAGGSCASHADEPAAHISLSDNETYWSFDGEFWRDELRDFVSALPSLCR